MGSLTIGMLYAISDEVHQFFSPRRMPQIVDILIDTAGVITGAFIMILLIILIKNILN